MARSYCSECGQPNPGNDPRRKTCSDACRSKRSKRLRRARKDQSHYTPAQKELAEAIHREAPDFAKDVIQEQLVPVVREALDQEVLNSLKQLVGLAPAAVAALQEDLASVNDKVRQNAYKLILQYSVGHPSLVKVDEDKHAPIQINFALPRPDDQPEMIDEAEVVEEDAGDVRECDACGATKPASEFVDASDRCVECFNAQQRRAQEILEGTS